MRFYEMSGRAFDSIFHTSKTLQRVSKHWSNRMETRRFRPTTFMSYDTIVWRGWTNGDSKNKCKTVITLFQGFKAWNSVQCQRIASQTLLWISRTTRQIYNLHIRTISNHFRRIGSEKKKKCWKRTVTNKFNIEHEQQHRGHLQSIYPKARCSAITNINYSCNLRDQRRISSKAFISRHFWTTCGKFWPVFSPLWRTTPMEKIRYFSTCLKVTNQTTNMWCTIL